MTRQQKVMAALAALIIICGGWLAWRTFDLKKNPQVTQGTVDPFAGLVIPEEYASDPTTKARIQATIDGTKAMYQQKPDIWETWIAIGGMKRLLRDYEGAIAAYQRSIEITPNNILGYRNMAVVYDEDLHDYEQAANYYRLAIGNNFADTELYTRLGFLYHKRLSNNEEAEKIYIQGLQKTGFDTEIYTALIDFYKATGNIEKYRENAQALVKQHPDNAQFKRAYADALN